MPAPVTARLECLTLPTYPVGEPERNPLFFERRVYQGSSGRVYPVPFIDKVHDEARPVAHAAAHLENEYVRLVLLPEIGGRILVGQDKRNGDFDFFYRQDVIKPALVGLAGPWVSGGVEFNWPQHHRPGTFLPTDVFIEEEPDGARTVWMSEHDPMHRLKGMHGLRLRPGSALIEVRVRLFNRTPLARTFLWWTNIAVRVHDACQSFFPPDVRYVADHAVRAQSAFPVADGVYYGVDYAARPGANDLRWYKNIPVPTSYMVCDSAHAFLGACDHAAGGGFVHVADRRIAPGMKQWTWGDHAFGHAWDRELSDTGEPYVELMAGVYTDNQPDFSHLAPYETKTFSQFLWPLRGIGPLHAASERAGLRLGVGEGARLEVGAAAPTPLEGARLVLREGDRVLFDVRTDLLPGFPYREDGYRMAGDRVDALSLELYAADGAPVLAFRPPGPAADAPRRAVATEPPPPAQALSGDELFHIGEHLEKYRHPTREPEPWWQEALARDPGDARCHLALGRRLLRGGRLEAAAAHFTGAIGRTTARSLNPLDGEAHHQLGLVRRLQGRFDEARDFLAKAAWSFAWRAAAGYELATLESRLGRFDAALGHLEDALDHNRGNNKAWVLRAALLRRKGASAEAGAILRDLLARDPLDHWARHEEALASGDFATFLRLSRNDAQTALDVAYDYADVGLVAESLGLLRRHLAHPVAASAVPNPLGRSPSVAYTIAWLASGAAGPSPEAPGPELLAAARAQAPDYFFPSRLHEQLVLEWARAQPGPDPLAAYALGNHFFDRRRREDAIEAWECSVAEGAAFATVHRNLGLARWNVRRDAAGARAAYARARTLDPHDSRLLYEEDQLRKRLSDPPASRLATLEAHRALVLDRDATAVELAGLYNLLDQPARALELLESRRFHPWEGGEGLVLRQYGAARLRLAELALEDGRVDDALAHLGHAFAPPASLGEARHLHQSCADLHHARGRALRAAGREAEAREDFERAAAASGDFKDMGVVAHSPMTCFRALALRELGREAEATRLFEDLRSFGEARLGRPEPIDYFATSLPDLLVFEEDRATRWDADHRLLVALACFGLGRVEDARAHLERFLAVDNTDLHAAALQRWLAPETVPA